MAAANNAAGSGTATATLDPVGDAATEKDAILRRLGELHRLLNSRKGSLSATYEKNAEANYRTYDLNQKTKQALDALAEDYGTFEATMANVTSEHEAGDATHEEAAETAGELERAQKDRADLDCSFDGLAAGHQGDLRLLGSTRGQVCKIMQGREVCNRRATHEAICVEARKACIEHMK